MASKGYVISVATDSRLFEQGVRMGIIKPVEDADEALTDLGKNKGPDQLSNELKDAQRATDKLGDEARQTAKQMQADYRKTAQEAREANNQSTSDFELSSRQRRIINRQTVEEIGNEAKQNAAETFSSFDGSAQSFVDGIQGTLGGLVSSLGPIGLAAGAAGALGIGLINGALQNGTENTEQFQQDVSDLTQTLIDAGSRGVVGLDHVVQVLQKLATGGDTAGVTLAKLRDLSDRTGGSYEKLADAYAGNSKALRQMVTDGEKRVQQLEREGTATDQNNDKQRAAYAGLLDQANAQKELNSYLGRAADAAEEAAKNEKLYADAGGPELEAKAVAVQNIGQAYQDAAGDVEDYTSKETGAFDTDAYVAAFQKKAGLLAEFAANMQKAAVTLAPEALAFIQKQGTDAAAPLVGAYVNGTAAQQQQLNKIWSQAGSASSASYLDGFKGGIPAQIAGPEIVARWKVDDSALQQAIRSQVNVTVPVKLVDPRSGKAVW